MLGIKNGRQLQLDNTGRASSARSSVVSPVLPFVRSARACFTHCARADGVRSNSRATAPTVLPASKTSRTAPILNSSLNCRRARLPAFVDPILDIVSVSFPDRLTVERRLLWSKERSCGSRGSVRPRSLASCGMPRAACPCRTCDGRTASARRHSSSGGASTGARRCRMCDNCESSKLNTPSSSGCTRTWRWSTRPSRMSCTENCRAVREATAGGGAGTGASVASTASLSRGEAVADGVLPASGAGESPGCRGNCGADGRRGALSAVGLLEAP